MPRARAWGELRVGRGVLTAAGRAVLQLAVVSAVIGDPVQAAPARVLVLIGLLAAEGVAVVTTVELIARGLIQRARHAPRVRGGRRPTS